MNSNRFREHVAELARAPGMHTLAGSFFDCCAYLQGYEDALSGGFLDDFTRWLRPAVDRPELAWPAQVMLLAIGAPKDSLSSAEDELSRHELFARLLSYLDEVTKD